MSDFHKQFFDIAIKRHISSNIFILCELKIFFSGYVLQMIMFWKDFEMLIKIARVTRAEELQKGLP